jgi:hypothetical protein
VLCKVPYEERALGGFEFYDVANPPAYLGTESPFSNYVFTPVLVNTSLDSGNHVLPPYPKSRVDRSFWCSCSMWILNDYFTKFETCFGNVLLLYIWNLAGAVPYGVSEVSTASAIKAPSIHRNRNIMDIVI